VFDALPGLVAVPFNATFSLQALIICTLIENHTSRSAKFQCFLSLNISRKLSLCAKRGHCVSKVETGYHSSAQKEDRRCSVFSWSFSMQSSAKPTQWPMQICNAKIRFRDFYSVSGHVRPDGKNSTLKMTGYRPFIAEKVHTVPYRANPHSCFQGVLSRPEAPRISDAQKDYADT